MIVLQYHPFVSKVHGYAEKLSSSFYISDLTSLHLYCANYYLTSVTTHFDVIEINIFSATVQELY